MPGAESSSQLTQGEQSATLQDAAALGISVSKPSSQRTREMTDVKGSPRGSQGELEFPGFTAVACGQAMATTLWECHRHHLRLSVCLKIGGGGGGERGNLHKWFAC